MASEIALYRERRRFFHRAVMGGALFALQVLVILGLLALFAT
jgi:hypothetical protein